ncbi:MAG: hypothetical protein GC191_09355 [Azospirillum sp.]|nr:hypothetical protein [Azospirillum sp.]
MVAYLFKPRFETPILTGTKHGTIRSERKRHARPGEVMQLETGSRYRRRRFAEPVCRAAWRVVIVLGLKPWVHLYPDGVSMAVLDLDGFARNDGFADFDDFARFFQAMHGREFQGVQLTWLPFEVGP